MEAETSFDTWFYPEVASLLMKQFKKHIIGLFVAVKIDGELEYRETVYTGFMLYYRNAYFWATAGHVINIIAEVLQSNLIIPPIMRWADDFHLCGAEGVPASFESSHLFSTFASGTDTDFGLIAIPTVDANCLLQNDSLVPIDERIWYRHETAKPAGYYIIGFPEDLQNSTKIPVGDDVIRHVLRFTYCCIPVTRVDYTDSEINKEKFRNPDSFYGKLMLQLGDGGPTSLVGMSGGPLLSIERKNDGLTYRLYGVQVAWDQAKDIIRAESIDRILEVLSSE